MREPKLKSQTYINYKFVWFPKVTIQSLMWKDKFDTPRCERTPYFMIEWLWFGLYGSFESDRYWEQWLWTTVYHDGDEKKAKEKWGWVDMDTNLSTWKDY